MTDLRIGEGYDVHRLVYDRPLIIGGVNIPHEKGLLGHSDADVLLHAVIDAVLGACALPDIGNLFPSDDDEYKDISSIILCRKVADMIKEKSYCIVNIDCTLIAQKPKLSPYKDEIRKNIANAFSIDIDRVSVKATTEEGLGFTGLSDGMAARAVALCERMKDND